MASPSVKKLIGYDSVEEIIGLNIANKRSNAATALR